MGAFSFLKDIFNKNIECDVTFDHIIFFLKKKKYLYMNKNIIVRDNTACIVVFKNRACDVFLPGKYKITKDSIPTTYNRANVERRSNKGIKVRKIRVHLYYVNTSEIKDFSFVSDRNFTLRKSELGKIKGCSKGECSLRVIDPMLLMKALLQHHNKVKDKQADNDVGFWIGNKINKRIEKNKYYLSDLIDNQEKTNQMLNFELEDGFDNLGIFVKNIRLKAIDFPKKYKAKVGEYLATHRRPLKKLNLNQDIQTTDNMVKVESRTRNTITRSTMQPVKKLEITTTFKTCTKCKSKNNSTTKICINCGNKL